MANNTSSEDVVDDEMHWKRKYAGLKRRYDELYSDTLKLSERLNVAISEGRILKRQKIYLLQMIQQGGIPDEQGKKPEKPRSKSKATPTTLPASPPTFSPPKPSPRRKAKDVQLPNPISIDSDTDMAVEVVPIEIVTASAPSTSDSGTSCTAVLGPGRVCKLQQEPNSKYCWKHAPLDPNSTLMFCPFSDPDTRQKCTTPILKIKRPRLCRKHLPQATRFLKSPEIMNGASEAEIMELLAPSDVPSAD